MHEKLCELASERAQEIVEHWGHKRPDGTKATVSIMKILGAGYASENIGMGYETASELLYNDSSSDEYGWMLTYMNGPEYKHKDNLLNDKAKFVGLAVYEDTSGRKPVKYWVADFYGWED